MTTESLAPYMDEYTRELYEIRREKAHLEERNQLLSGILRQYIEEHGPLNVEGVPALDLKHVGSGKKWDSHAIEKIINDTPHMWQRLLELGAVSLNANVIQAAVKNGQLPGMPPGWTEGTQTRLEFERARR